MQYTPSILIFAGLITFLLFMFKREVAKIDKEQAEQAAKTNLGNQNG